MKILELKIVTIVSGAVGKIVFFLNTINYLIQYCIFNPHSPFLKAGGPSVPQLSASVGSNSIRGFEVWDFWWVRT